MPNSVKKELTVQEWTQEIISALEYRRQYALEESWARLESMLYNTHWMQDNAGPNIIMETADAMLSALLVPDPYITVKARRSDVVLQARVQESTDNMLVSDMEVPREVARAVLTSFTCSQGILKIGYDSEFGWSPRFDLGGSNQELGMTSTQFSKYGDRIEYGPAQAGMPWVSSVAAQDFVVPWGRYDIDYCEWVAHRVVRHIDDIKADPKYNSRGLRANISARDATKSYESAPRAYRFGIPLSPGSSGVPSGSSSTNNAEYCELWEIHDRRTGKIYVIATGHDKFLRNEIDVLQLEGGLPFVSMSFVPRSRNFWTTPDAFYLEQVQRELNDISIQSTKHRRARVLKYIVSKGMFSPDEMENFLSEDVGVVAEAESDAEDLGKRVIPLAVPADMGLPMEAEFTRTNARSLIGLSVNQTGEFQRGGRRSATEAQIVQNASTLRMDRRSNVIARTYRKLFEIINPICWRFWTTPRLTQIMTAEGKQQWVSFVGEHLRGSYSYSVGFSTGGNNETIQARRQNALQLWAMMQQNPMIDPTSLAQYLNLAFNDPEFTSIFKPGALNGQLASQMQMMAQMQQQGAQSGGSGNQGSSGFDPAALLGSAA